MKQKKYPFLLLLLVLGFFLNAFVIFGDADLSMAGNKLLIITTPKYAKVLDKYIQWKIKSGLDVELDTRSAEKGADAIQKKLQEKYDREGITYIVLVGDIDDVPSVMLGGYPSDPSYTLLEENQLIKFLKYEKGDFESFDWIRRAVVASMTGFDGIDHAGKLEISLKAHPDYFDEVIKIMESDRNITKKIQEAIEKTGVNFIAHHGHGSTTAFGSLPFTRENAANLKNFETGFPIIHGAACSTGSFWIEDGDCLAEAFMKAGTVEKPAGAIAFLGGATGMDPGACIAAQKEVFMKYYFDEDVETIGELFYQGTLAAMQKLSHDRGERLFRRWHLFGDCSTPLWKKIPAQGKTNDFPVLNGPYLGQKPPGLTPKKFAPGIVSFPDHKELGGGTFSTDGKEFYFTRSINDSWVIMVSRWESNGWTFPKAENFSEGFTALELQSR